MLGKLLGFTVSCHGEYPGWDYAEHSAVRDYLERSYQALFGKKLKIEAIHAGLECGLFRKAVQSGCYRNRTDDFGMSYAAGAIGSCFL